MDLNRMDLATRFWMKVSRPGGDACWEWLGGKDNGYGVVSLGSREAGRMRAHRLSWTLVHGPIPDGKDVLHKCDNRPCVNPKHLYLGTDVENARDRKERGGVVNNFPIAIAKRKPGWNRKVREDDRRGGTKPKLSPDQVRAIRRRAKSGEARAALCREYGVSYPTLHKAIHRLVPYGNVFDL